MTLHHKPSLTSKWKTYVDNGLQICAHSAYSNKMSYGNSAKWMINSRNRYSFATCSKANSRVWLMSNMKCWCRSMRIRPGSMKRTSWYRKENLTIHNRQIGTGLVVMHTTNKIYHRNPSSREGILMVLHSAKSARTTKSQRIIMQRLMKPVVQTHPSSNHLEIQLTLIKMEMLLNLRHSPLPKMIRKMEAMPRDQFHHKKHKLWII